METNNSLDFLVDETFRINEGSEGEAPESDAPEAPGVFYKVDHSKYFSVLKIGESSNLSIDYRDLKKHSTKDLFYFETNSFSEAQFLSRTLNNYKSLKEESDLNSHELQQVWWGAILESGELVINFGRAPFRNVENKFELGPLGDSKIAIHYFKILNRFMEQMNWDFTFEQSGQSLTWKLDQIPEVHTSFKAFLLGKRSDLKLEFSSLDLSGMEKLDFISLMTFLSELSLLRNFWTIVEDEVKKGQQVVLH